MLTILGICKIFENKNFSLNLMKNKLFNTNCSCMLKLLEKGFWWPNIYY